MSAKRRTKRKDKKEAWPTVDTLDLLPEHEEEELKWIAKMFAEDAAFFKAVRPPKTRDEPLVKRGEFLQSHPELVERWAGLSVTTGLYRDTIASIAAKAATEGDCETLKRILKGFQGAKEASSLHTKFSRAVVGVLQAAAEAMAEGRKPSKRELINAAIVRYGEGTFDSAESSRWTEVLRLAGLQWLPKATGKPK